MGGKQKYDDDDDDDHVDDADDDNSRIIKKTRGMTELTGNGLYIRSSDRKNKDSVKDGRK